MNINCFVGGGGYNIFQIALRETLQQLVTKETNITHDEHITKTNILIRQTLYCTTGKLFTTYTTENLKYLANSK